jgi:hypothetical protein
VPVLIGGAAICFHHPLDAAAQQMLDDGEDRRSLGEMLLMPTTGLRWIIYVLIRRDPL